MSSHYAVSVDHMANYVMVFGINFTFIPRTAEGEKESRYIFLEYLIGPNEFFNLLWRISRTIRDG